MWISCCWCFIEPCIWNLSTEYKNNKRKQTTGIQHLCESHAKHRMILFFHHNTNTRTNAITHAQQQHIAWKLEKCAAHFHHCDAQPMRFSLCTIRWWVSPAAGWARVSFHIFDVKTLLHLSRCIRPTVGLRLHAFWFGHYYYLYLCVSCDAFAICHICPAHSIPVGRLHPSQISSRMVHTSLDCMCAEVHTVVMESISNGSMKILAVYQRLSVGSVRLLRTDFLYFTHLVALCSTKHQIDSFSIQ